MRRLIVVVLLALSALASSHAGNAADDPIEGVALAAVNPGGAASKKIFFSEGDTFAVTSVETRGGRKYVRLSRKHLGIPVADEVVRLEFTLTGELLYAAPTLLGPIEVTQVTPQISSGDAEKFALAKFPYLEGTLIEDTRLVIYFSPEVKPTLSWLVRIGGRQEDGTPSNYSSFVSAQELKILGLDDITRTEL